MISEACTRCGADATVIISDMKSGVPQSRLYCEPCWRVVREQVAVNSYTFDDTS